VPPNRNNFAQISAQLLAVFRAAKKALSHFSEILLESLAQALRGIASDIPPEFVSKKFSPIILGDEFFSAALKMKRKRPDKLERSYAEGFGY